MWNLLTKDISEFVQTVKSDTTTTIKEVVQRIPTIEERLPNKTVEKNQSIKNQDGALIALQTDLKTYTEAISEKEVADFHVFLKKFDISSKTSEISELLQNNAVMAQLHTQLVPESIPYEDFWTRYFYRLGRLRNPRAAMALSPDESDDELGWGGEDAEGDALGGSDFLDHPKVFEKELPVHPALLAPVAENQLLQDVQCPANDILQELPSGNTGPVQPSCSQSPKDTSLEDKIVELQALVEDLRCKNAELQDQELSRMQSNTEQDAAIKRIRESMAGEIAVLRLQVEEEKEASLRNVQSIQRELSAKDEECQQMLKYSKELEAKLQEKAEELDLKTVQISQKDKQIKEQQEELESKTLFLELKERTIGDLQEKIKAMDIDNSQPPEHLSTSPSQAQSSAPKALEQAAQDMPVQETTVQLEVPVLSSNLETAPVENLEQVSENLEHKISTFQLSAPNPSKEIPTTSQKSKPETVEAEDHKNDEGDWGDDDDW